MPRKKKPAVPDHTAPIQRTIRTLQLQRRPPGLEAIAREVTTERTHARDGTQRGRPWLWFRGDRGDSFEQLCLRLPPAPLESFNAACHLLAVPQWQLFTAMWEDFLTRHKGPQGMRLEMGRSSDDFVATAIEVPPVMANTWLRESRSSGVVQWIQFVQVWDSYLRRHGVRMKRTAKVEG